MRHDQKISNLIALKRQEIFALTIELSELLDNQVFESEFFTEEDLVVKEKTGRKKTDFIEHKVKAGYENWVEDFVDEDTGDVISIPRKRLVSINGKRTDITGRAVVKVEAKIVQTFSDEPVWKSINSNPPTP